MKNFYQKFFGALLLFTLAATTTFAQIPNDSPLGVEVIIQGDNSGTIVLQDGYSSMTGQSGTPPFGFPLLETVSAPLEWARDDGMYDADGDGMPDPEYRDSFNCSWETTMDLTGKMALVRRGACFFSQKVYNAQEAGATGVIIVNNNADVPDEVIGMAGGDSAAAVTIPAIFISFRDGEVLADALDGGDDIDVTFRVEPFSTPLGPTAFQIPQSQIIPFDSIQVSLFNSLPDESVFDVGGQVDIIDPSGTVTTLTTLWPIIEAQNLEPAVFPSYTPSEEGLHTMIYTNGLSSDTIVREFFITNYTYAIDEKYAYDQGAYGNPDWIAPGSDQFINDFNLTYDFGAYYDIGPDGATATHFTFALANPDTLFQDDPDADKFDLVLYDGDPDGDGVCGPALGDNDWSNYDIAAIGEYILDGTEEPFDLLTVELVDPVTLKADGCYTLMVEYDGANAGIGVPPWYVADQTEDYITKYEGRGSVLSYDGALFIDGWAGGWSGLMRLHLDGFDPTIVSSSEPLDATKVQVMPNPANEYVNIIMNLDQEAEVVEVGLMNIMGNLIDVQQFDNVRETTLSFNVSNLPAGTYFFAIRTPEGFRTEKFVVSK